MLRSSGARGRYHDLTDIGQRGVHVARRCGYANLLAEALLTAPVTSRFRPRLTRFEIPGMPTFAREPRLQIVVCAIP